MRLTCPSCSAEYEIDAGAIGASGRRVRCSNCSAEWFQQRQPASVAEAAAAVEHASRNRPRPQTRQEVIEPEEESRPPRDEPDAVDAELAEESEVRAEADEPPAPEELAASLRAEEEGGRSGGAAFLAGFASVAAIGLLLIAIYAESDAVAEAAPAVKSALASYVDLVDQGRAALARFAEGLRRGA